MRSIVTRTKQAKALLKGVSVTRRDYLCLGLIIALWTINNALWACRDTTPPTFYDDSRYLYVSLRQLAVLRGPWQGAGELMDISHRGRPPLYTLVTQPVYLLVGTSEDAAIVATNAIFIAILVVSVYGIGKRLFDSRTGVLAAILLAGYPTVTVISRRYLPHFAAVALIALGAYLLLRTDDFRDARYAVLFGVVSGLGMLTSAWVVFGLLALGVWIALRSLYVVYRTSAPEQRRGALLKVGAKAFLALAIAMALLLPWYLRHRESMFQIALYTQTTGVHAPVKDQLSVQAFLWYLLNMHRAVSVFFVPLFLIGVLVAIMRPKASSTTLLLWFGGSYLLLSLLASKSPGYYLIMLLPPVALLSAFWIFEVQRKAFRVLLIGLMVLVSSCVFVEAAWGLPFAPKQLLAFGVKTVPPVREEWHMDEILQLVREDSQGEPASVLVVAEIPGFHPGQFVYQGLRSGLDCPIRHCRWASPNDFLNAEYITVALSSEGKPKTRPWAGTPCETWSDFLRNPPDSFMASHTLLGTFSGPWKVEARVYKLTRPLSSGEAITLLQEISLFSPQTGDAALHETLGRLYREQQRFEDAAAEYERAIELDPTRASAYWGLGLTYERLGRIEEGVVACQEAARLNPSNPLFHETLGRLYRQHHRVEEALAEYEKAIELDPSRANAYWGLGLTYERLGRIGEAVAAYEEALSIDPASEPAQQRLEELYAASEEDSPHPQWRSLGRVLAFLGYNVQPKRVGAGGTVHVTVWWQALDEMDRDYTAFIHVLDQHDRISTQQDRLLQHGDDPTSTWEQEETVRASYELELPGDTSPGEYTVKVGVYYWQTGERLPVWDENGRRMADDAIRLEPVTVTE